MQVVTSIFSYIIDMGASVMMPIILTILGLIMGAKFGEALRAGMTFGVGFIGLNAVIGIMSTTISSVGQALVENLNFPLTSFDVGWAAGSAIAWSTEAVPFIFLAVIVTNIVMIMLGWTKTMDVDIWNYWHVLFSASAILLVCGNTPLAWAFAIGQAVIMMAIIFIVADWTQADCVEVFGLDGISLPHIQSMCNCIVTYPLDRLIGMIPGIKDINWTSEGIAEKLGLLGEPMIMGFVIGGFLSALAEFTTPGVNVGSAIQQIFIVGMNVAAVLVLIPRMVALLMEGLMPISEFTQTFLEKRFPGKELYIGLDAAVATGHPFVIALALLAIPIIYIEAIVLPWNTVLPLADLAALVFYVECAVLPNKGNLFRGLIETIVMCAIYLTFSSYAAEVMTGLAGSAGLQIPEGAAQITSIALGAQWITWFPFMLAKLVCL
ncbi:PTS galactitol transporter subunit IIC [Anaerofustis stercorihominis]|uniref:PTS galactitol transporter subunit IIC n=1 Tax=Anaerofustis stercorihominis TaxID=214853 RepID=A0A3E3E1Q8_9FIRM|nr:PTS transporter subunit IIC [Anaerofustis stercorihominis]RGD75492.1 PTS galactitol transporter subunit IIC [Anaerofustis stercorihominis]